MNLDKAQKATCKRMTDKFVKKDPSAMAFFDRLKGPIRDAFMAERTKLLGTVQQNEFGLPDEPSLAPSQIQTVVKKTRGALEGDSACVQFLDKIRDQAGKGQAYAQAMMRIHDALVEKWKNGNIVTTSKPGVPTGPKVVKKARDGSVSVQRSLVTEAPPVEPSEPDLDLALVKSIEADPEHDALVAKCSEQLAAIFPTLVTASEAHGTELHALLVGVEAKDGQSIMTAAHVFSKTFMPPKE